MLRISFCILICWALLAPELVAKKIHQTRCQKMVNDMESCRSFWSANIPTGSKQLLKLISRPNLCENASIVTQFSRISLDRSLSISDKSYCDKILQAYFKKDSELCEDCVKIIADIKSEMVSEHSVKEIVANLNQMICYQLPKSYKDMCSKYLEEYMPGVVQLLVDEIDSKVICSYLGVCPWSIDHNRPEVILGTGESNNPDYTHARQFNLWSAAIQLNDAPIPSCQACKNVISQIITQADDESIQETIKHMIEKACSSLSFLSSECEKIALPIIIEDLKAINVDQVCALGKMCPIGFAQNSVQASVPIPGVCGICEALIESLLNTLPQNRTEEAILDVLNEACSILPDNAEEKCKDFVKYYGAAIVETVVKGTAPKLFCTMFGVCSQRTGVEGPMFTLPAAPLKESTLCSSCKTFVWMADYMLKDKATEESIIKTAENLCNELPGSLSQTCTEFLETYGKKVLDYLVNNVKPEEVCSMISLCSQSPAAQLPAGLFASKTVFCRQTPVNVLCADAGAAHACDLALQCATYSAGRRLHALQLRQAVGAGPHPECWVCNQMVREWRFLANVFRGPFEEDADVFCALLPNSADRQACMLMNGDRGMVLKQFSGQVSTTNDMCKARFNCESSDTPDSDVCLKSFAQRCASMETACRCGAANVKACFERRLLPSTTCPQLELQPAKPLGWRSE